MTIITIITNVIIIITSAYRCNISRSSEDYFYLLLQLQLLFNI